MITSDDTVKLMNDKNPIEVNGVIYPKGSIRKLELPPKAPNPNRLRNKRERQNRRKGRKP